jgi:DNA polymerase-3 subunit beta
MEFTISRDEFFKALQHAQGVVSSKGPMPILANALIEAEGSGITIFATNLDIGLRGAYEAKVASSGKVSVQAKKLHDIVRELPSGEILVKVDDDGRCRMTSGKSKFNLPTISPEEFPSFPEYDKSKLIGMDAKMLADMIRKTSFAISQDETRMTLNGALFEVSKTKVRMVATDGHRLAYVEREGAFGVSDDLKVIIARKAIAELSRLIGEADESLKFCMQDNHIIFVSDSLVLAIRLIEGAYPNYEQVIPKSFDREATINVSDFGHCLRRVATLADEKSHMIRLSFSSNKLELISEGGELGEAKDEMAVEFTGDDVTIGLNVEYVLNVLGILDDDDVIFHMQDQLSPVMAQPPDDTGLIFIIMPMRL